MAMQWTPDARFSSVSSPTSRPAPAGLYQASSPFTGQRQADELVSPFQTLTPLAQQRTPPPFQTLLPSAQERTPTGGVAPLFSALPPSAQQTSQRTQADGLVSPFQTLSPSAQDRTQASGFAPLFPAIGPSAQQRTQPDCSATPFQSLSPSAQDRTQAGGSAPLFPAFAPPAQQRTQADDFAPTFQAGVPSSQQGSQADGLVSPFQTLSPSGQERTQVGGFAPLFPALAQSVQQRTQPDGVASSSPAVAPAAQQKPQSSSLNRSFDAGLVPAASVPLPDDDGDMLMADDEELRQASQAISPAPVPQIASRPSLARTLRASVTTSLEAGVNLQFAGRSPLVFRGASSECAAVVLLDPLYPAPTWQSSHYELLIYRSGSSNPAARFQIAPSSKLHVMQHGRSPDVRAFFLKEHGAPPRLLHLESSAAEALKHEFDVRRHLLELSSHGNVASVAKRKVQLHASIVGDHCLCWCLWRILKFAAALLVVWVCARLAWLIAQDQMAAPFGSGRAAELPFGAYIETLKEDANDFLETATSTATEEFHELCDAAGNLVMRRELQRCASLDVAVEVQSCLQSLVPGRAMA